MFWNSNRLKYQYLEKFSIYYFNSRLFLTSHNDFDHWSIGEFVNALFVMSSRLWKIDDICE